MQPVLFMLRPCNPCPPSEGMLREVQPGWKNMAVQQLHPQHPPTAWRGLEKKHFDWNMGVLLLLFFWHIYMKHVFVSYANEMSIRSFKSAFFCWIDG